MLGRTPPEGSRLVPMRRDIVPDEAPPLVPMRRAAYTPPPREGAPPLVRPDYIPAPTSQRRGSLTERRR